MTKKMTCSTNGTVILKKTLVAFIAGVFLFTGTSGWTQEEMLFSDKLASPSGFAAKTKDPLAKSREVFEEEWQDAKSKPLQQDARKMDEELKYLLHFNMPAGMIHEVQTKLKAILPKEIADKIAWDDQDMPYVSVTYFTVEKSEKERVRKNTESVLDGLIRDNMRPFKFTGKGVGIFVGKALFIPMLMDEDATRAAKAVQAGFNEATHTGPNFPRFVAHATFGWIVGEMNESERNILFNAIEQLRHETWGTFQVNDISLSERWFYKERSRDRRIEVKRYILEPAVTVVTSKPDTIEDTERTGAKIARDREEFRTSATMAAICKHIEHDGNLDDKSYLNDVLALLDSDKNPNITVLPYEIIIEIPNEGLAVRYFDPTKANVITPYSSISKLSTKVIGTRLNRQIIYRVKALPSKGEEKATVLTEEVSGWKRISELDNKIILNTNTGYIGFSAAGPVMEAEFELWVARHGQTHANHLKVLQGNRDIPVISSLTELGQKQAEETARALFANLEQKIRSGERIIVVTSTLSRSKETAIPFINLVKNTPGTVLETVEESDANEISFGAGNNTPIKPPSDADRQELKKYGIKLDKLSPEDRGTSANWIKGDASAKFGGGESFLDVMIRSKRLLEKLNNGYKGKATVVLIGHAVQINAMQILLRRDIVFGNGGEHIEWLKSELKNSECRKLSDAPQDIITSKHPGTTGAISLPQRTKATSATDTVYCVSDFSPTAPNQELALTLQTDLPRTGWLAMDKKWTIAQHIRRLKELYGESIRIIGYMTNGNAVCNVGYISFMNGVLYYRENEPVMARKYSVFAVFKKGKAPNERQMQVLDVKIENTRIINIANRQDITDDLNWMISGERIVRSSVPVDWHKDEDFYGYQDPRHLYLFPLTLTDGRPDEVRLSTGSKDIFRGILWSDVDKKERARRGDFIDLSLKRFRELGYPEVDYIKNELKSVGYIEEHDFYFKDDSLWIKLKDGFFQHHSLGVTNDGKVKTVAVTGHDANSGCTMSQLAERNVQNDLQDAIVLDQGKDVLVWREDKTGVPSYSNRDRFTSMIFLVEKPSEINNPENATASTITSFVQNQANYSDKNKGLFRDIIGENKLDILVRIPVEVIESVGTDNIKNFLATFQEAPNGYIELYYMSGTGEVSEIVYQKYGLQKKSLPKKFKRTRENTVTLFPSLKGEEIDRAAIISRLGNISVTPENTILSPIGLQHDPAGLIRATILGLKMMDIARQIKEKGINITKDQVFKDKIQLDILEQLKNVCDADDLKNFNLSPDDIIALATGTINNIITSLKKLIKLLPITPINAEELRQIYEYAKQALRAA